MSEDFTVPRDWILDLLASFTGFVVRHWQVISALALIAGFTIVLAIGDQQ